MRFLHSSLVLSRAQDLDKYVRLFGHVAINLECVLSSVVYRSFRRGNCVLIRCNEH